MFRSKNTVMAIILGVVIIASAITIGVVLHQKSTTDANNEQLQTDNDSLRRQLAAAEATPTSTPTPVATPTPTAVPKATATPKPTASPTPTSKL